MRSSELMDVDRRAPLGRRLIGRPDVLERLEGDLLTEELVPVLASGLDVDDLEPRDVDAYSLPCGASDLRPERVQRLVVAAVDVGLVVPWERQGQGDHGIARDQHPALHAVLRAGARLG